MVRKVEVNRVLCLMADSGPPPKEDAQNMAKTAFSRLRIAYFFKMCNDNNLNEKIETINDYI